MSCLFVNFTSFSARSKQEVIRGFAPLDLFEDEDLFPFDSDYRDERSLFYLGGPGTGVGMHSHTNAWNALVYGKKRWSVQPDVSRTPTLSLSLSLSFSLSPFLSFSLSLTLCLSLAVGFLYFSLCLPLSVSVALSVSFFFSLLCSLSLSLWGRDPSFPSCRPSHPGFLFFLNATCCVRNR